jgi:predicted XRE-type DNA-binding protein
LRGTVGSGAGACPQHNFSKNLLHFCLSFPNLLLLSMQPTSALSPAPQQIPSASSRAFSNSSASFIQQQNIQSQSNAAVTGGTPSQKDFAIALGVSQARISQLVKIGMPLNSIAAAKEWRLKRSRSNDDSGVSEFGESADSSDQCLSAERKGQSIMSAMNNPVPSAAATLASQLPSSRSGPRGCCSFQVWFLMLSLKVRAWHSNRC